MKHLSGKNFAALCDTIYTPNCSMPDDGVIYCHVNHVMQAFSAMSTKQGPFVLVSSQGGFSNGPEYIAAMPGNLIRWFSVGVSEHQGKIQGIPIGIADSHYNSGNFDHGQWRLVETERNKTVEIENLLHVRFCLSTNGDRVRAYDTVRGYSWATVNVFEDFGNRPLNFQQYLEEMHKFKFTLSPYGSGFDCHRTWEALYLGVIPIVKRNSYLVWFEGELPICWVNGWGEVTEVFLNNEYDRIKGQEWNMDMLWMDYWEKEIRGTLL